jgi:type II secretory pathway component GspD/PulD (secretin)
MKQLIKSLSVLTLMVINCYAVDFKNIKFSDFIGELSQTSGKNIIVNGDINTNFSVFLPDFDHTNENDTIQILRSILEINNLDFKVTKDVIIIFTPEEEEPTPEEEPIPEPKNHYVIKYKHLNQKQLEGIFSTFQDIQHSIYSDRALIFCTQPQINTIKQAIKQLDNSYTLKHLSVTVIATDNSKVEQLGTDFEIFTEFGAMTSSYLDFVTSTAKLQFNISDPFFFTGFINAMHKNGLSNIVYSPVITILDGKDSVIESTTKIPITTGSITTEDAQTVTTNTTEYTDVGLKLNITEVKIIDDQVSFTLDLYIQNPLDTTSTPRISSKHINTHVLVDHENAFLLGGINSYENYETERNIPIIENIPLLGHLTAFNSGEVFDYTFSVFITLSNLEERKNQPKGGPRLAGEKG